MIDKNMFLRKIIRTIDGEEYHFNVYSTRTGYVAESLDFKPMMVLGKDKYELQSNMEWLVCQQKHLFCG